MDLEFFLGDDRYPDIMRQIGERDATGSGEILVYTDVNDRSV